MNINKLLPAFLCMCIAFYACKKSKGVNNREKPEPIKTEKGVAIGSSVSKIIGPGGGELTSGDGKLKVTVPAGAVSGNTEFIVQPITNTLFEGENRIAYRLLPEGNSFSNPVQLRFTYSDEDTLHTTEDALTVASQQADGSWKISPAILNKASKILTVETNHFSDWTITGGIYLSAEKTELGLGEKTMIKVVTFWDDEVLAPLIPALASDDLTKMESVDNWKIVSGIGSLGVETGQLGKLQTEAEYGAPADMTSTRRTMTIGVDVKGFNLIKDPAAPAGVRKLNKMILLEHVTVVKEYMKAVIGGTTYTFTGSDAIAVTAGGSLLIGGTNSTLDLDITILGNSPGTYNCNFNNGVQVFITNGSRAFSTSYLKCNGAGAVYSGAPIELKKVGAAGEWVEGKFSGSLFDNQANACAGPVPTVTAEIEFNVIRRN